MQQSLFLAAIVAATGALAAPAAEAAPAPLITPAPKVDYENIGRRATACTFSGSDGYSLASKSKASCATIVLSALTVPSGVTLDLTDLNDNTEVIFEGETTWEYEEWEGPLFDVSGTGVTITGASGAILNGNGADYWDGEGSNGGKTKPKFFQAHKLTSATIASVTISNAPVQVFSINQATHLAVNDVYIDNSDGDDEGANTDGFDIGESSYITITNAKVYNQDDCVAVNSGDNIVFTGGYCSGGHGLSIGSIGGRDDNTVDTVTFSSSTVTASQNGVRIKTISGDTGTVSGVTYSDITLENITKYGIYVTQAYNGDEATTGVPITDFELDGVTGTVGDSAYTVWIDCGSTSSCSSWTWTDVSVTGGKGTDCVNEPSAAESYC